MKAIKVITALIIGLLIGLMGMYYYMVHTQSVRLVSENVIEIEAFGSVNVYELED